MVDSRHRPRKLRTVPERNQYSNLLPFTVIRIVFRVQRGQTENKIDADSLRGLETHTKTINNEPININAAIVTFNEKSIYMH